MHTLFITGPGGAGRTTVAAATALAAARAGRRVLLLLGDQADRADRGDLPGLTGLPGASGLPALFGPPDGEPAEAAPGLWAVPVAGIRVARTDSGEEFRSGLVALQEHGSALFSLAGARPLGAEELTELPGAEQFALLRALRLAASAPGTDLLVVDLPPLHQAVTTLALPAQLRRYLARLLPSERQAARALRPVLAQLAGVPMPAAWLYEAAARWDRELAAVQAVVQAPTTEVRLVAEAGPAADAALRTGRLGLALHELPVSSLIANRTVPRGSADPWLAGLAAQQRRWTAAWADTWAHAGAGGGAVPVTGLAHLGRDPRSPADLDLLAATGGLVPAAPAPRTPWAVEDRRAQDGVLVWAVPLPGADKRDLDLVRRGDELLLTAGPYRRAVPLPAALRRCTVSGAALTEGVLRVRFTPDPGLWPRTA